MFNPNKRCAAFSWRVTNWKLSLKGLFPMIKTICLFTLLAISTASVKAASITFDPLLHPGSELGPMTNTHDEDGFRLAGSLCTLRGP
jgi:hypothetical protein